MSLAWSLKLSEFALISSVTFPVSFLYLEKKDKINTQGNPNQTAKDVFPKAKNL